MTDVTVVFGERSRLSERIDDIPIDSILNDRLCVTQPLFTQVSESLVVLCERDLCFECCLSLLQQERMPRCFQKLRSGSSFFHVSPPQSAFSRSARNEDIFFHSQLLPGVSFGP